MGTMPVQNRLYLVESTDRAPGANPILAKPCGSVCCTGVPKAQRYKNDSYEIL